MRTFILMAAMSLVGGGAFAQDTPVSEMSVDEFIYRLAPPVLRTRGVSVTPSIDMAVTFDFASAELTEEARLFLDNLGIALQSSQLANHRYRLNGHTDAVGTEEANDRLSLLRAEAVQAYLASAHNIDPERLEPRGLGERALLDAFDPEDDSQRRVEIELMEQ